MKILQEKQLKTTMHGLNMFKRALYMAADVTITYLNGEIIEVNERFIKRTSYKCEELIDKTHNIVNPNTIQQNFSIIYGKLLCGGTFGEVK